ncbi:sporulation protein YpjB [Bacillus alkalicellulosilyticus]|uniref:sporulation protein YpjB n=1 Tax=Alkalihalobacterium alkalicellulosilyticum TaxID=1912214 RepID=UPI000998DAA1|nr:sporulation protein YpjB [Bacillus alkalicellulosilyticus]
MRNFAILAILLVILTFPTISLADHGFDKNKWNELNELSDKVLQLIKQEKYGEAKQVLEYFSEQFLTIHYDEANVTMKDLRVVTSSFDEAFAAVTSASMTHEERILKVTEFRLAIDALSTDNRPLWKNSQKSIYQAIDGVKEAVAGESNQELQHRINHFLRLYQMIRPALMLDLEGYEFQRLESYITFLERYRHEMIGDESKQVQLLGLEKELKYVYEGIREDSADPSLLWVMFTIGGMIIVSLSYVGWKKYRAEKKKVKLKQ